MFNIFAAVCVLISFAWLALSLNTHWRQVYGGSGPQPAIRVALRVLGWTALMTSGVLCFVANRPSMAILVWIMLLATAAPIVAFTLSWRAETLRLLWPARFAR